MIINNPEIATFIHVPKTAGTSIKFWLYENFDDNRIPKITEQDPHSTDKSLVQGFSFCCVRNPWDRMYSTFWWLKRHAGGRLGKPYGTDFTKFINDLDNEVLKPFTIPQTEYVNISDHVLRYETLDEDFKFIQRRFRCKKPLEVKNKSRSGNNKYAYKHVYTDEDKEKVYSKFRDEIELLGYTFEK